MPVPQGFVGIKRHEQTKGYNKAQERKNNW